ncbi:glycerophosphodiester phosphodiesterase [Aliikangiella coralliicola]|uniref:Glycerophosphodiester phosphodiesterase n=1 Tax=Aliikangiella coralliicola TaxID=2592383 RepID=A0A545UJL8_9GAMM|nr:glycerophosphodiester phosphodiesterase family protein [Aliikangiella coralliicola]TQV89664.1 glycerophosphodiester phosphodiesterase [Aliikangiella coralliicola]
MRVIAHRGASGHEPENTLLAIEAALKMQVDAVEIDIHQTEGELIVIHDRWLHKTTDGEGRVSEKPLSQLKLLDAGKGEKIPTLWEVLTLVAGRCDLNIELKSEKTVKPLLAMLEKAMSRLGFEQSQFLLSSFNHHLLREIKLLDMAWRIGALTGSRPINYARFAEKLDAYSIHIDIDFVDECFVNDAHERGLKVFVYTVDYEEDIADLHRMRVDGIFTNYPTRSMVRIAHLK